MIVILHHLDGTVEHRKSFGQTVPPLLVRPNYVVFVPSGPKSMRELGPRERAMTQPRWPE